MEDTIYFVVVSFLILGCFLLQCVCYSSAFVLVLGLLLSIYSCNAGQCAWSVLKEIFCCFCKKGLSIHNFEPGTTIELENRSMIMSENEKQRSAVHRERRISVKIPKRTTNLHQVTMVSFGKQPIHNYTHLLKEEQKVQYFLKRAGLLQYLEVFLERKALYMDLPMISEDQILLSSLISSKKDQITFRKFVLEEYPENKSPADEKFASDLALVKPDVPTIQIQNCPTLSYSPSSSSGESTNTPEYKISDVPSDDSDIVFINDENIMDTKPSISSKPSSGNLIVETKISTPMSFGEIEDIEINPDLIEVDSNIIGQGSYAVVFHAHMKSKIHNKLSRKKGVPVAVKRQYIPDRNTDLVIKEVRMIMNLIHPYIIRYYGCYFSEETITREVNGMKSTSPKTKQLTSSIVMEYCINGNLFHFIHSKTSEYEIVTKKTRLRFLYQIANGLSFLHKKEYAHRDIKLQNILVDKNFNIRICDFGTSKRMKSIKTHAPSVVGTPGYMAPELFGGASPSKHKAKFDIFSFGIIMWEIWTGLIPFQEELKKLNGEAYSLLTKISQDHLRPDLSKVRNAPSEFYILMKQCWRHDPEKRPKNFKYIYKKLDSIRKKYEK